MVKLILEESKKKKRGTACLCFSAKSNLCYVCQAAAYAKRITVACRISILTPFGFDI